MDKSCAKCSGCSKAFMCMWTERHKILHLHNLFCKNKLTGALCHQHAGSPHCLDLLLGPSAEEFSLDDDGLLGQFAFAKNLVVTLQTNKMQMKPKTVKILSQCKYIPKIEIYCHRFRICLILKRMWTFLEPPECAQWWHASRITSEGIYKAKSLNLNETLDLKTFSCVRPYRYRQKPSLAFTWRDKEFQNQFSRLQVWKTSWKIMYTEHDQYMESFSKYFPSQRDFSLENKLRHRHLQGGQVPSQWTLVAQQLQVHKFQYFDCVV